MASWFDPSSKIPHSKGKERLVDVWRTDFADLWFRLVPNGCDISTFEAEPCGEDELGFCSDAFKFEMDEFGYESWFADTFDIKWMLLQGIAPRQPLLLRLYAPVYTQSWSDYGYDYDGSAEWELIRVQYWQRSVALRYWDRYLRFLAKVDARWTAKSVGEAA
jgi:hypothetical protein